MVYKLHLNEAVKKTTTKKMTQDWLEGGKRGDLDKMV